jgi:hypothetical protein
VDKVRKLEDNRKMGTKVTLEWQEEKVEME